MAKLKSSQAGKFLYGFLFVVVLPVLLVVWARATEAKVHLPAIHSVLIGSIISLCGGITMLWGMISLTVYGKGLPMSPYPPTLFVSRGIYNLIAHPIYTGFCILCIGVAIGTGSASGLWLVSATMILGCVALVQGFEKHGLRDRFGPAIRDPILHLPSNDESTPTFADRLSVYALVLFPWLILYEAVRFIGLPPDAVTVYTQIERSLPVFEWTEVVYASTYIFVIMVPIVARTRRDLRDFSISGLIATGLIILLFLTLPFIAPPRPFTPHGLFGRLLNWERSIDTPAAAFPSFHVLWAFLAARVFVRRMRSWKYIWWGWAIAVSISCITTGMHAAIDVVAGFIVFAIVACRQAIWDKVRGGYRICRELVERVAFWTGSSD